MYAALDDIERPHIIPINMPLDAKKLQKPLRKLRKSLKQLSGRPAPEEVHDLRTRTRRLEAILHALMLDRKRPGRRLLRTIAPIRKQAGKVRDMDVLTGFAAGLTADDEEECRVQLIEALGGKRIRFARKLRDTAATQRSQARQQLKRYAGVIDKGLTRATSRPAKQSEWPADAMAVALQLSSELARWPAFKADNIHPFRLKVKELRYVLQLAENADSQFIDALGETKDAIGEWHDWTQLEGIAAKVLDHGRGCNVLKEIHSRAQEKFDHAISVATHLRREYLPAGENGGRRGPKSGTLKSGTPGKAVVTTLARLAA